jgi:hypothetical protein
MWDSPKSVIAAALYLAGYSAYLLATILEQIFTGAIHSRFSDAAFPVVFVLGLSAVPAIFAFGLLQLDDLARRLCIAFCALHVAMNIGWMQRTHALTGFGSAKIAAELAIIALLCLPHVRREFAQSAPELRLRTR